MEELIEGFKKEATFGELYSPAMELQTEEEAKEYFDRLVRYHMKAFDSTEERALYVQKFNIGYWTGYCDSETMQRVQRIFKVAHPIFGSSVPSAEEAFEIGEELGANND